MHVNTNDLPPGKIDRGSSLGVRRGKGRKIKENREEERKVEGRKHVGRSTRRGKSQKENDGHSR